MQILASQRDRSIPVEQWREQIFQKFSAPDMALKSYGGHRVDIVSQTPLQLTLGKRQIDAEVLVQKLKQLLTTSPVLAFPDFSRHFLLETDASGAGLGAVLAQEQSDSTKRPIAYASCSLLKHEKNYGIAELEGLGVVWAVKHFRPYLYGNQCVVYTDHQALKSLLNTPQPSGKLARWGMALQEMDLTIQYRSGKHNENADALSRYPHTQTVPADADPTDAVVATLASGVGENLATLQRQDEELSTYSTWRRVSYPKMVS